MKAILAFAFLVIAAQATTPAYLLGFTDQIGLNGEQMKHGEVCFAAVRQVMMDVHHLVQSKQVGVSEVLRSAIELIQDVEHKLKIDCSIYMNDIVSTFMRNYKGGDIKEVALRNWNIYSAEIIQQIAKYFDFVAARNDYEAGRTEAYIYQILFGIEKPKVLPVPEFNISRRVQSDFFSQLNDFNKGYYERLGLDDTKGIQDSVNCTQALVFSPLGSLQMEFIFARNTSHKLQVVEKAIRSMVNIYETCSGAVEFNLQNIILPIAGAFKVAPVHATLAVIHNIALNLPEIKHTIAKRSVASAELRLNDFGALQAELLLTAFSNIYPRHF